MLFGVEVVAVEEQSQPLIVDPFPLVLIPQDLHPDQVIDLHRSSFVASDDVLESHGVAIVEELCSGDPHKAMSQI